MKRPTPQMAIADVMLVHDDLTVREIVERAEVEITPTQCAQILFDMVRRGHAVRTQRVTRNALSDARDLVRRDGLPPRTPHVYSLTVKARNAAMLICSPAAILALPTTRPAPPRRNVVRKLAPVPSPRDDDDADRNVRISRRALQLLADAAAQSSADTDELRQAIAAARQLAAA